MRWKLIFIPWLFIAGASYGEFSLDKLVSVDAVLQTRFSEENARLLHQQHPKLNIDVTKDILWLLRKIERHTGQPLTPEKALSKFSLYAAIRVGFINS